MPAATISGIPVYEALVNREDTGMVRISLVDDPAVLVGWQAFRACLQDGAANGKPVPPSVQLYSVEDEERRIVRGVIMRADFPIYRRDHDGFEYYVIYHADTIRQMAERYLAESRQNRVDTNHDGNEIEGVQMVQWFIKDTAAGINPQGFDADIADGSLFAEFHVTDDAIWEQVKAGTFRGFSLEGFFDMRPEAGQQTIDEIVDELAGQFHLTDMSKIERIKELLRAELARQDAMTRPEKFGAVTTDRGPLEWDGEDDLKEGDRVYIVDEEGNRSEAPDGEYMTEDGKTIVVVDGAVAEIRDSKAQVANEEGAEEEVQASRQRFDRRRAFFEESYADRTQAIVAAVLALRGEGDWYIEECGDDFAIVREWDGEGEKLYRYTIAWNEDGTAVASLPQEVEETYVPVVEGAAAEPEPSQEEELRSQLNDANARIASLEAELAAARKKPAAKPAHEEVRASEQTRKTGNKKLDRVAELLSRR